MTKVQQDQENLLVIVGRLLEASKAAADGIKSLSEESKANTAMAAAAQQAVASLHQTVNELDRLVRSNPGDNLIQHTLLSRQGLTTVSHDITEITGRLDRIEETLVTLSGNQSTFTLGKTIIIGVIGFVAWGITTGIALYAAIAGKP